MTTTLPQNVMLAGLGQQVVADWMRYVDRNRINIKNDAEVQRAWGLFANQVASSNNELYRASGLVELPNSDYKLYQDGPFSWQDEDLIADFVTAGSPTIRWIPTVAISSGEKNAVVSHLEWIAPNNWDGNAYSTYLAGLDIADCGYGPDMKWNGFQYQIPTGQASVTTKTFNRLTEALPYDYKRSPRYKYRGRQLDYPIDNDVDFHLAMMAEHIQKHAAWVLNFGDITNQARMEFDGLDKLLTSTYVTNHLVPGSTGVPSGYSSPLIVDGTTIGDIAALILKVRKMVRVLRNRASKRMMAISPNDMAIRMPLLLWQKIAEYLAVKGQLDGINRTHIPADAETRLDALLSNPAWSIDGQTVPVLIDDDMASLSSNTVTTDIQILTRRIGNMVILQQEYVDWRTVRYRNGLEANQVMSDNIGFGMGGIVRTGWIEENAKCFYFFAEMMGRLISMSQPNQGVITSFSFTVDPEDELEGTTYTDSYYANFGTPGSIGAGAV